MLMITVGLLGQLPVLPRAVVTGDSSVPEIFGQGGTPVWEPSVKGTCVEDTLVNDQCS